VRGEAVLRALAVLLALTVVALAIAPHALGISLNFYNSTITVTVTTSNGPVTSFNLTVIEGSATQVYRTSNDIQGTAKVPVAWIPNATVLVTAVYTSATAVTHITNTTTSVVTTTVTATNNASYILPASVAVPAGSSVKVLTPSAVPAVVALVLIGYGGFVLYYVASRRRADLVSLLAAIVGLIASLLSISAFQLYQHLYIVHTYLLETPNGTSQFENASVVYASNPYTPFLYIPFAMFFVAAIVIGLAFMAEGTYQVFRVEEI
jgi:hypothetical protein